MKKIFPTTLILVAFLAFQACKTPAAIEEPAWITELDTVNVEPDPEVEIYQATESRINDLLHTKLEVSFDWDSSYLHGDAWLTFTPYFYPVDSLILDAKGHRIKEVAMLDEMGKQMALTYTYDTMKLAIDLGRTYTREDTYKIYIEYTAMPDAFESGGSSAIRSEKGLYFINPRGEDPDKPQQIWTQGETESSSRWFPTIDAPNEKTTQEIYITVDTLYETLSNGKLLFQTENGDGTRTDYWKQELPHPPYLFMMAIGDYAIVEDQWKNIPVNYYVEHEYEAYAKDIYPNTPEMLEFFSAVLDYEYPWDKFHQVVVRDYVSGAMENTGAVIYGEFVQGDDRYLIDNSAEDVVAHEMFHHWFGDLVTTESWANLPLNESFATYGEYLWNEHKYGRDKADMGLHNDLRNYLSEARIKKESLIRYDYEDEMEMFDRHSYQKGSRVLHMLRKEVGDDAFFAALSLYLRENEYQPAEIAHLRLAFEEVTGRDLHWFFDQWFMKAGHPIIEVEKKYVDSTSTLEINLEQTQEGEDIPAIFKLPISVEIVKANGEKVMRDIFMDRRDQTFTLPFDEAPLLVNLDADKSLLLEMDQDFSSQEAAVLYEQGGNFLDRYLAIEALNREKDSLSLAIIEKALNDPFWKVRRKAIASSKYLIKEKRESSKQKLIELANEDSVSAVRAEAIETLGDRYDDNVQIEVYTNRLKDSSYIVVATALEALSKADRGIALKEAAELEGSYNSNVIMTVAKLYAEETDTKYNGFFKENLSKTKGFSKYTLMVNYQEYLIGQDDEVVLDGINNFFLAAQEKGHWFMRMGAVNALIQIKSDYEARLQEIEKRKAAANDPAEVVEYQKQANKLLEVVSAVNAKLKSLAENEDNDRLKSRILKGM